MLFVGSLHLAFEFVICVVDGSGVADEWFGFVYSFGHFFVLADYLIASNQA